MTTLLTTRRTFLGATGALVLGACTGDDVGSDSALAARADGPATERRTFVFMHGSWHGGWCWPRVADPLRAAGHRVYTLTQTGLGERSHLLSKEITLEVFVADLVNVLEWEDLTDAVLVGHSFGGIAVSGAADKVPERIRHLVFLDSLLLRDGESAFSAFPRDVVAARRKLAREFSGGVSVPVPEPAAFGITDPADAAWLKSKCTPHPLATYEDEMRLKQPLGNGLPATYVAVTPEYGPTAASRALAKEQQDWRYLELDAAHDAMVSSPQGVIDVLLQV